MTLFIFWPLDTFSQPHAAHPQTSQATLTPSRPSTTRYMLLEPTYVSPTPLARGPTTLQTLARPTDASRALTIVKLRSVRPDFQRT